MNPFNRNRRGGLGAGLGFQLLREYEAQKKREQGGDAHTAGRGLAAPSANLPVGTGVGPAPPMAGTSQMTGAMGGLQIGSGVAGTGGRRGSISGASGGSSTIKPAFITGARTTDSGTISPMDAVGHRQATLVGAVGGAAAAVTPPPAQGFRVPTPPPVIAGQPPGYQISTHGQRSNIWQQTYKDWPDVGPEVPIPAGEALTQEEINFFGGHGFAFDRRLGKGAFGSVWRCKASQLVRDSNGNFMDVYTACKIMSIDAYRHRSVNNAVTFLLSEGEVLNEVTHDNIVCCEEVLHLSQPTTGFPYMRALIFMELCDGDLYGELRKRTDSRMSEQESHGWFRQIADGLLYLHDRNVIHFDIKLENIMVKTGAGGDLVYKLGDFGLSRMYMAGEELSHREYQGTQKYMAPEMPQNRRASIKYMAKPVDCYALGICLCESLASRAEWQNLRDQCQQRGNYQMFGITQDCANFVRCITFDNPAIRLTGQSLRKHKWFNMY